MVMSELTSQRRWRVGDAYPCEYCGSAVGEPCVEICERPDAGEAARRDLAAVDEQQAPAPRVSWTR
jgi:hypothetical protein